MNSGLKVCMVSMVFSLSLEKVDDVSTINLETGREQLVINGLMRKFKNEYDENCIELTPKGHAVLDELIEVLNAHLSS